MSARKLSFVPTPIPMTVNIHDIKGEPIRQDQALDELKSSIELIGILQPPVLIAPKGVSGKYEIVAGRRRLYVLLTLGIEEVLCNVYPKETQRAFIPQAAIAENSVRSNNIGSDILAMKQIVKNGERDPAVISAETGLPKGKIIQLLELIDLPESVVNGIVSGVVAPTTAKEVKKLRPQAMERAMTVLEETGKLTGKDIHKVREVQVDQAAAQIDLPSIPELPNLDTLWTTEPGKLTVLAGTPEKGKTAIVMVSRETIVGILEGKGSDKTKIKQLRSLVGLGVIHEPAESGTDTGSTRNGNAVRASRGNSAKPTLAQRSRTGKSSPKASTDPVEEPALGE